MNFRRPSDFHHAAGPVFLTHSFCVRLVPACMGEPRKGVPPEDIYAMNFRCPSDCHAAGLVFPLCKTSTSVHGWTKKGCTPEDIYAMNFRRPSDCHHAA